MLERSNQKNSTQGFIIKVWFSFSNITFTILTFKGVYVKVSLKKMLGRRLCKELHKEITLEVDGKHVELPPIEGIIILNIMRYEKHC